MKTYRRICGHTAVRQVRLGLAQCTGCGALFARVYPVSGGSPPARHRGVHLIGYGKG